MSSSYISDNIEYTGNLIRPGTTKGSILSHTGVEDFEITTPTGNNQILVADSTSSNGTAWSTTAVGLSAGFPIPNGITPNIGNTSYFLVLGSTAYVPGIPTLTGTVVFISVRPKGQVDGWLATPSNITGGNLNYTLGYIPTTAEPSPGNFVAYPGGPHFQVPGSSINTPATRYTSFFSNISVPILAGQKVCIRLTNNFTGSNTSYSNQNAFLSIRF